MNLRAITIDGNPYTFNISDCPVSINDKFTGLIRKPGSPLLLTKSIVRGLEEEGIYEFDYVSRKNDLKFLGFVVYIDGFYIYDKKNKTTTRITDTSNLIFNENVKLNFIDELEDIRNPIRFISNGILFRLNRIMFSDDNELYIDIKSNRSKISIDDVQMCTGINSESCELYYGQILKDGVIEFNNYRPRLKMKDNTYRDIEESDYIELGII